MQTGSAKGEVQEGGNRHAVKTAAMLRMPVQVPLARRVASTEGEASMSTWRKSYGPVFCIKNRFLGVINQRHLFLMLQAWLLDSGNVAALVQNILQIA